jgi:hypothetical protein
MINENYYPPVGDLDRETLLQHRAILEQNLRTTFPDLDMHPNTVFGDLWAGPASTHLAACSEALRRLQNDLDLERVAGGEIYDCDFVRAYLRNWGVSDEQLVSSRGTIQLVWDSPDARTLDRKTVFVGGEGTEYGLWMPEPGPFYIREPGADRVPDTNDAVLVWTPTGWTVEIPVIGQYAGDEPPAPGLAFETNTDLQGLVSAAASSRFTTGVLDQSLARTAARTRERVWSATAASKGGIRSFFRQQFVDGWCWASATGDSLQMRGTGGLYLDIWAHNQWVSDTVVVRGQLVGTKFVLDIRTPNTVQHVDNLVWVGDPDLNLWDSQPAFYMQSTNVEQPLGSAGRGRWQRLWAVVDMPLDPVTSDPLIDTQVVNGEQYADFEIAYRQDPYLDAVDRLLSGTEYRPVGVLTSVRGPSVHHLESMVVRYTRKPGTRVNLTQARQEIYDYIRQVGYPGRPSQARIVDSLFYAGAQDVREVLVQGVTYGAPAAGVVDGYTDPVQDLAGFESSATAIPAYPITDWSDFEALYLDPNSLTGTGPENSRILLDLEDIKFEEVV